MRVCDTCKKEKTLIKYTLPIPDLVEYKITHEGIQVLQSTCIYKAVIPKQIELCEECAIEIARKIWN